MTTGEPASDRQDRLAEALGDRYTLQHELGRGGMAVVYLAHDRKLGRDVALKVLRPELAASLGPDRFLREIEVAARLTHPSILAVHDCGEAGGQLYYTMPYLPGESLRDRLERERQLPIADALQLTKEIADGLAYAHAQGIIHRDIKPENILLEAGHAVVADFGIAQALRAVGGARLTATGLSLGTPAYMSPEQAAGEAELDGRSDVYSLGCVLYELLAGVPPHVASTAQALLAKKLQGATPRIAAVRKGVPPALEAALTRALAKNPADRFETAAQFADALAGAAVAAAPGARPAFGTLLAMGIGLLVLTGALVLLLGLPDWLWQGAVTMVAGGVAVVLAGEWRRRGARGPWLTRRRAFAAGGAALLVTVLSGATYLTSRTLGVGPFATPISRGQLQSHARVVLADFAPIGVDTSIADAITQLLRVDLGQSRAIRILAWDDVREALARMRREGSRLETGTALELARREGLPAVVGGEVRRVGGQYLLLASLTATADSAVLTSVRETARDSSDLIAGAERLSRTLRGRIGENLRNVRAAEPLARWTTASLPALMAYDAGVRAAFGDIDYPKGIRLLEQAIALDTTFAGAYQTLAAVQMNSGRPAAARAAADKAYLYRERLPEVERLLVEAMYHASHGNLKTEEAALIRVGEISPGEEWVLLSDNLLRQRRFAEAESVALRAVGMAIDSGFPPVIPAWNAIEAQVAQQRFAAAESVLARVPPTPENGFAEGVLLAKRDYDGAWLRFDSLRHQGERNPQTLAALARLQGRLDAADRERGPAKNLWWLRYELRYDDADTTAVSRALDARLLQVGWDTLPPERRETWLLVPLLAELGRTAEARQRTAEWKTLGELDPRLPGYVDYCEGSIALADGRMEDAAAAFLRWHAAPFSSSMHWFNRGLTEAAGAFDRLGRADTAIALYQRALALRTLSHQGLFYEALWYPFVLRRLGELHESLGHRDQAIEYYGRFIELWKDADPSLQPQVQSVRSALTRLARERG